MRKRFLIAAAILFLTMSMSFAFGQTPTPTPNSSPILTPESPSKKETPKEVVVTKDGTVWFVTKDLLPVYTIPKLCPFMVGDDVVFLSCEFPKLPVKSNPPVKVDPMSPGSPIPKPRIGMPGDGNSEQFLELRRQQLYDPLITMDDIKKSDAVKSTDVLTVTNPSAEEIKQQITPTPTPTPLAERVVEVVNPWDKDDIVGKSPVPSSKQHKNLSIELSLETGINSSYDDLNVTDRFYDGWVVNQDVTVQVNFNEKLYCGGEVWLQNPIANFKPSFGREADFRAYCGGNLPKGFNLEGGAAKFIIKGGSVNNYFFSLSKEIPLNYDFNLTIKNQTDIYTSSSGRGGLDNKTEYVLSKKLVNDVVTSSLTFAHIVDNDPYYDKRKLNLRGLVAGEVDMAIGENSSVFIGGGYYFGIFKNTIRQDRVFFQFGFRFNKIFKF